MLLYCFNIYLNVILPSTPKFPKWPPSFVFQLKLSVNFTSISLPRTSHTCNFKDQTLREVSWPRNSAPYVEYQYSFLCSMIISWARWIQISPSQHLRCILILSSIYNYIIQIYFPHDSRLKLMCIFSPIAKVFGAFYLLYANPLWIAKKKKKIMCLGGRVNEWMYTI